MEVRDPLVIQTSLEEAAALARIALEAGDIGAMMRAHSKLNEKMPPMSGLIYLALNKGTVDQLSEEDRDLAELIEFRDTLREAIDAGY